jgi:hypothetical protein
MIDGLAIDLLALSVFGCHETLTRKVEISKKLGKDQGEESCGVCNKQRK